jgi:succinate-semialdehyde dehydrogenase / glutarate-semialdehyde dehydrogenase
MSTSKKSTFSTFNPHTGQALQSYEHLGEDEAMQKLSVLERAFYSWSQRSVSERLEFFMQFKRALSEQKTKLAEQMTLEMGKPLAQSLAEVDKSISLIDYICENGPKALQGRKTEAFEVVYQPLGIIYGIMPWNFPLWQVVRFALPALMAGNAILLKHADSVAGSAKMIGDIFSQLYPGLFLNLALSHEVSEKVIADPRIRGVSLTGSTVAGRTIATQAGKSLKKCVLELGSNDAYVILPDADLDYALTKTFEARLLNAGQSCISAKRIFVPQGLEREVLEKLKAKISQIKMGDPMNAENQLGPLARLDLRDKLLDQLKLSVEQGAEVYYQMPVDKKLEKGFYFPPTLLCKIGEDNIAFQDELFGPVFAVITYQDEAEALRLANTSKYGLGGAVFSKDLSRAYNFANKMETGSVAINDYFRSAPEKPFGGVKDSGHGRELGSEGFLEFVNVKTLIQPSKTPASTLSAE